MDIWSLGCIFSEFYLPRPLFEGDFSNAKGEGNNDLDQLGKIFMYLGTPTAEEWPHHDLLPRYIEFQSTSKAPYILPPGTDKSSVDFLNQLLVLNPNKRITAQEALASEYFNSLPLPSPAHSLPR